MILTKKQRVHLRIIRELQKNHVFNSGYWERIDDIMKYGIYDDSDAHVLNNIGRAYSEYKRTNKVPDRYCYNDSNRFSNVFAPYRKIVTNN